MKSILYIGAFLMIGAGIYGFVDYKKTSSKAEFTKMYDSNDEPAPITDKSKNIIPISEKIIINENKFTKKKLVKNKPAILLNTGSDPLAITDTLLKNVLTNENVSGEKEKKILSYRLFSRAPLERKYINKELKLDTVNKQH